MRAIGSTEKLSDALQDKAREDQREVLRNKIIAPIAPSTAAARLIKRP
jgi:hypothetical protein